MKAKSPFSQTLLLSCFIMFLTSDSKSQSTFQKTFGGSSNDYAYAIEQTADNGYIIAGYTESFGEGSRDVYLVRTDPQGDMLWSKTIGQSGTDYAWTVAQTADGGFIAGVHTSSFGAGGHDINLIRTDAQGDVIWSKVYGGTSADGAYSLRTTFDGGFIVAAHTSSYGAGQHDIYLLRIDSVGEVLWTKTYGNSGGDFLRSIDFTPDLGFIMVAETNSFGAGGTDIYVVRTDAQGDTLWTRTFGGAGDDYGNSIRMTNDQAYIIAGNTRSFGQFQLNALLMKIDDHGEVLWAKTYGGEDEDFANSVEPTADGGYIVTGGTKSFAMGGICDLLCNDVYLIKTDENGDTLWTKAYGSLNEERGWSVRETSDGGYAIAGISTGFGAGGEDFYFIKTDADGNTGCNEKSTQTIVGTPNLEVNWTTTVVGSGTTTGNADPISGNPVTLENTLCQTTSVEELNTLKNFRIFPNPATGIFQIDYTLEKSQNISIQVLGLDGRVVFQSEPIFQPAGIYHQNIDGHQLRLSSGVYVLKIKTEETQAIRKLSFIVSK
jgi:Secretion system C-terminal sorting domain